MELTERDYEVLRELGRWRWLFGRHIKELVQFPSTRTADRRLKALLDAKYIERKKILYGIPSLYFLTHKGRVVCAFNKKPEKIRVEMIRHDSYVLDCLIYFLKNRSISVSDVISEKELHIKDGFGNRKHYPDFVFSENGQTYAVEIELSVKTKERLENNAKLNYLNFDSQYWIIEKNNYKLQRNLEEVQMIYDNITIAYIESILQSS